MSHIIAIETYGSQRVRAPASRAMVSAFKIGYTTVGKQVLLTLYGSQALDVTPQRASYHYVSINGDKSIYNGTLLFAITDDKLAKVEAITRQHPTSRSGCWRWLDNQWQRFPTQTTDYVPAIGREGPSFNPAGYRTVSLAPQTATAILAERTQRTPQDKVWWWLSGDTYPHRELLKRWGCRWSKKRKSWYFIGDPLPQQIQDLLHELETTPAEEIPQTKPTPTAPQYTPRFALNDEVYLSHELTLNATDKLETGTRGMVVQRYQPRTDMQPRYLQAYAVNFNEHGIHTLFEGSLSYEKPDPHIRRQEMVMVIPGTSAKDALALERERRHAIAETYDLLDEVSALSDGQPVYYIGTQSQASKSGATIQRGAKGQVMSVVSDTQILVNFETAGNIMMHISELSTGAPPDEIATNDLEVDVPLNPEPIRIIKPQIDDNLQALIKATSNTPLPELTPNHKAQSIGQAYCGELTGSITGNVFCYGYAVYQGILLYINFGGPRMAVEAIRARLAKGEAVNLVPDDAPAIELSAGESDGKANTGMYSAYVNSIAEAKFTSMILVHEYLTLPNYGGKSLTGIFRTSQAQAMAKLLYHVRELVNIPVFDAWAGYLYQAGQAAGLVRSPRSGGDIDLLVIDLDVDSWSRLITGGLANQVLQLPVNTGVTV